MGFSPASVPEGFQRASGKPFGVPAGAYSCPGGAAAPRGVVLSFEAKESTKESTRHGATGKSPLLPILTAGLAMSRAMKLDSLRTGAERARARLFPPSKWAGLFPSAAYRRPRPRGRRRAYASLAGWDALAWRCQFSRATSRQGFKVMLAFGASRRVCHPTAVCAGQLTGNHTRPASHEACRRAAVKPRPTFMSPYAPARLWRAVRGAGRREEACIQWMQPP